MKQVTSTFHFTEAYNKNFIRNDVTVILDINYSTKTFSIRPLHGGDHFKFVDSSYQWELWKAVIKAIDDAIDFANQEVGNTNKVVSVNKINQTL